MEWTKTKNALSLYKIVLANDAVGCKMIYLVIISLFLYNLFYIYIFPYELQSFAFSILIIT